ncbi:MAG: ATP-binding cassette domain-containing protein [Burkholderiaceae bacterium]
MATGRGHELRLEGITKRFGDATAVHGIDLTVSAGELVALLGPSGCGKSTLLRIISGFMPQSEGRVLFDGQSVDHLASNRRGVGIVFQNYALFPHMTVRQNIAYGLEVQRQDKARVAARVEIAFLAELNRVNGGTNENFDPAFKALRELLPSVGAIAANLGAYATLWQQEQIDIAPYNFNFVQTLKGKGVPVEFVVPETGAAGWDTSLHLVAGSANAEAGFKYIETHLDPAVQAEMMKPPYNVIPTNGKVALAGEITKTIAKTAADLGNIRGFDWDKLNPQRGALIERFNREIRA